MHPNPGTHASSGDPALDHAIWMGSLGYRLHPVRITIDSDGKKRFTGLPKGWQSGGETRASDIALVWRSVGATGYLIATGPSGITVIDLDHHPDETPPVDGRAAWSAAGGARSPFVVSTWSGGEHHYFAAGGAGSDSVGLRGVDVRGVGGGIVGPGSLVVDAAGVVVGKYTVATGSPDRGALPPEPPLPDHVKPRGAGAEPGSIWNPPKTVSSAARQWEGLHQRFVDGLRHHAATGWGAEGHGFLLRVTRELAGLAPEHARQAFDAWFAEAGVAPDARDLAKLESALTFPPDVIVPDHVVVGTPENPAAEHTAAPPVGNLPEEFWASRYVLGHIRAAAHSRACSADAVLGVLLARIASCVPGGLRVDTGVRVPTPLSTYAVLLGDSGTGKSSAASVAMSLMPEGIYLTETHPMGSGEGLCDAYMSAVKASDVPGGDPDAKGVAYVQTEHNAFFHADEGARVLALGSRSGSTLLPLLRDAWSGGEFGQRNTAAGGKNRKVSGATLGAWIGLQQPHAAELLTGANAVDGTVQRFLWFASSDPSIPDQAGPWPGPIPMAPHALNTTALTAIGVDQAITAELRQRQVARARGVLVPAAGREQDDALRVRLGALLALLDGRAVITQEDWALALVLLDTSAGHVARVRATQAAIEREKEDGRIGSRLRQRAAERDDDTNNYETEVERIVVRIVSRMAGQADGLTKTRLRESVARNRRDEFETALVLAEDRGLVRVVSVAEAHGDRVYPA